MVIRNFIETYRFCPMCRFPLKIEARHRGGRNSNVLTVSTRNDRLLINIRSDYFISSAPSSFEFSISIINGEIISCGRTNEFVSLYDLNLILKKECKNCLKKEPMETFCNSINFFYHRPESIFTAQKFEESFGITDNYNYYYYCNNYEIKSSTLSVQPITSTYENSLLHTPYVPLEKFNFNDRDRLLAKIHSIQLLH